MTNRDCWMFITNCSEDCFCLFEPSFVTGFTICVIKTVERFLFAEKESNNWGSVWSPEPIIDHFYFPNTDLIREKGLQVFCNCEHFSPNFVTKRKCTFSPDGHFFSKRPTIFTFGYNMIDRGFCYCPK